MKEPDEKIARVLAALRDAEPSAGMQVRILKAMESHGAGAPRPLRQRLMSLWLLEPVLWKSTQVALCVAMLCIAAGIALRPLHTTARRLSRAEVKPVSATRRAATGQVAMTPLVRRASRKGAIAAARPTVVSFPAPPLPLTEQERLLMQLARQRDPKYVAILERNARLAESAKMTQQFQKFFEISDEEMRKQLE